MSEAEALSWSQTAESEPAERRPEAGRVGDRRRESWLGAFRTVRGETERRAAPLSPEDQVDPVDAGCEPDQVAPGAHDLVLRAVPAARRTLPGYRAFDERFAFLFNSYYVAAGPRHARPKRGPDHAARLSREVAAYRAHVDEPSAALVERRRRRDARPRSLPILEIGLHHEQQHQELILTDILHAFAQNPLLPGLRSRLGDAAVGGQAAAVRLRSRSTAGRTRSAMTGEGFAFDNEGPRHEVLLRAVRHRARLVTNGEWLAFMQDGGYAEPALWLSDGWARGAGGGLGGAGLLAARSTAPGPDDARRPAPGRSGRPGHVM